MSRAVQRTSELEVGGPPRAMLLPPEIAQEAKAKTQRRGLIGVVLLVLVLVGGAYVGATLLTQKAQSDLLAAQNETATLLAEQTQYSEVQIAQSKADGIRADQLTVTTAEIDWKSYLQDLQDTLPPDASIESIAIVSSTPLTPVTAPASPLDQVSIAQITLTATTKDVPDIVEWINSFATLPGYAGATPTNVTSTEGGYQASFAINVNSGALANRFVTEDTE
jgi:Tfp pilus assembly protein PilN